MKSIQTKPLKTRVALITAAALLLGGAIAFFCGEWGPGIGKPGVISKLFSSCGIGIIGCSLLLLDTIFLVSYTRQFLRLAPKHKQSSLKALGRQTAIACLNVLVYGGIFIVAMGGIAALDAGSIATTIFVFVVWGCCIAAFVLYRRHRKTRKISYDLFNSTAITLLLFLLGAGMLAASLVDTGRAIRDLEQGPSQADVFLVDAKIDYPYWKYSHIIQADHILTFFTADEERIVLVVPENDVESAMVINDQGNFVHLAYYPGTQVLCSAERWDEGRQVMGDELLKRLDEQYDFYL